MALTKEESEYIDLLEVGHGIVVLKDRVFVPLHVVFPKVEVKKDDVMVTGTDKEAVGHTCSNIELATKVRCRDKRIFQDGIYIASKPKPVGEAK